VIAYRELEGRVGGRWGLSLVVFLVGSPFWILGFTLNESASYTGWTHAAQVFALALVGQVVMGGVFYLAHLTIAKNRHHTPVAFWLMALIWSSSAIARVAFLIVGLSVLGLDNSISTPIRVTTSILIATLGFGIGAYSFDALHRFMTDRAEALKDLLEGEEELSTHRAAVQSMKDTLVAQIDSELASGRDATEQALSRLENSLMEKGSPQPALEELRVLSDQTWQRISEDLWKSAPAKAPRVRGQELLGMFTAATPFRIFFLSLTAPVLYLLIYIRAYDPVVGVTIVGAWVVIACGSAIVTNAVLRRAHRARLWLFGLTLPLFMFSAIPLVWVSGEWGFVAESPIRVVSLHAITVFVAVMMPIPTTIALARAQILDNLTQHIDATTLEKLHVESQLAVVSQQIASKLHGDVRGNFLASVLTLQHQLDTADTEGAHSTIGKLRATLAEGATPIAVPSNDRAELELFLNNWAALVDIDLEFPLNSVPEFFLPAFHTVVVDGVNNAVRHGAADWIRVGMTVEEDAIVLTLRNNGLPHQSNRAGMGTAHLNQLAPHNWTRLTTEQGTTQLLVRLHKDHVGTHAASRG